MRSSLKNLLLIFITLTIVLGANAQETKKILSVKDYPKWNRIVSTAISDNGAWISYGYRPNDGDDTLYIKNVETGQIFTDPYCSNPQFSFDSKWVAYEKNLTKKESEQLKQQLTQQIEQYNQPITEQ